MVNFTTNQVRSMMDKHDNVRNISVIAHVDHGKSTLTDSLIGKAGIIAEAREGEARFMDTRPDEQARSITIKATSVSLYYERKIKVFENYKATDKKVKDKDDDNDKKSDKKENKNNKEKKEIKENKEGKEGKEGKEDTEAFLINLIDSPGHVDFSSEVTAALRVTDGALVVVDCIEGVCVQTETVLRQAIGERIRPILFLNKLDRIFLELSPTLEECYKNFRNSIESVNVVCSTYQDKLLGNCECFPDKGTVGFGSGLHAWGFTLSDFAFLYGGKFGLKRKKMMQKLWGENYWSVKAKKWVQKPDSKKHLRSFCQFVLLPIKTLFDAIMGKKRSIYDKIIKSLRLKLPAKELPKVKKQKDLLKLVMRTWLPAGDALLDMITSYLPSPKQAQRYRVENLYTGPLDSEEADCIRKCDSSGPLSMYISKMVPTPEKGRFLAFGRVFSGCVKTGQEVRILGPDYEHGKTKDLFVKKVQRTMLMMGRFTEHIPDCPAGNVCGLMGIDQYLAKSGTITTSDAFYPFHTMSFSVAAVVRIAVEPKNAADLPKLIEGLKRLSKSDQLVKCTTSKSGQHIIAGAGQLHLEVCMKDLREEYLKGAEVDVSDPVVSFAETVTDITGSDGKYPEVCVSKSPNKHNRLYFNAQPLDEVFVRAVEKQDVVLTKEKKFAKQLATEYKWDPNDVKKIWTFGCFPDALGNCVVDQTKGAQYVNEVKDHIIGGFMQVVNYGILCDEMLRSVKFNLLDIKLHADAIHRGAGQIQPATKSVMFACQIASTPRLMEPVYLVNISVPQTSQSGVFSTVSNRRGTMTSIEPRVGTPLTNIVAYLPVKESFGFTEELRKNTGGKAFPQMKFSHWQVLNHDPFEEDSFTYKIIMDARKRKGLKNELPNFNDYFDKID